MTTIPTPPVKNRDPFSDAEMSQMGAANYCEDCGAEVPSYGEHGMEISFDDKLLCPDCCFLKGGYHIEPVGDYAGYNQ